jgi:hypothetical protein
MDEIIYEQKYHWFKVAINSIDKTPFHDGIKFALAKTSMEIISSELSPDKHGPYLELHLKNL